MDFFLWGHEKGLVYTSNYENMNQLKAAITAAFQQVTPGMVASAVTSFVRRLSLVIEADGGHIEV